MDCYKKKYKTKKMAWDYCLYYFIEYGWPNKPYICKNCNNYHTTTHGRGIQLSKEFIDGFNKWFGRDVL